MHLLADSGCYGCCRRVPRIVLQLSMVNTNIKIGHARSARLAEWSGYLLGWSYKSYTNDPWPPRIPLWVHSTTAVPPLPIALLPNLPLVDTLYLPLNANKVLFQFVKLPLSFPSIEEHVRLGVWLVPFHLMAWWCHIIGSGSGSDVMGTDGAILLSRKVDGLRQQEQQEEHTRKGRGLATRWGRQA